MISAGAQRARTVYPNRMIAHLWAHQSQHEARNGNRSFFFAGDTIYSYGGHFPIARIVKNGRGGVAALFNPGSYSTTTSCHQSIARDASRHLSHFTVPSLGEKWGGGKPGHADNVRHYRDRIQEAAEVLARARTHKDWRARALQDLVAEANSYATFFGLRTRFVVPSDQDVQAALDKARRDAARRRKEEQERQRLMLEEAQELIEQWKVGKDVRVPAHVDEVFLRVRRREGERLIETSKGAEVPLSHAVRLLPYIRSGQPYEHTDHALRVGHFRIDAIDAEGNVTAGCHFIKRAEMDRLAAELGL
jgi:hypothetical protein